MQTTSRKQLRTTILQQRSILNAKQQQHASKLISQQLAKTILFLRSKRIAFYFAYRGEVDPSILLTKALSLGKECFFPILHPTKHNKMWFGRYEVGIPLEKNYLGILEPNLRACEKVAPWSLDLVVTPLVAFDNEGNRLGMGGGFYDRTFSFLREQERIKPLLVGLAYDFQHAEKIDAKQWDIPLDLVITESTVYDFHKFKK